MCCNFQKCGKQSRTCLENTRAVNIAATISTTMVYPFADHQSRHYCAKQAQLFHSYVCSYERPVVMSGIWRNFQKCRKQSPTYLERENSSKPPFLLQSHPNDDAWRKKRNNCAAQQPCAHQLSESRFENLRIEVVELSGAHQGIDINVFAVKLLTPIT